MRFVPYRDVPSVPNVIVDGAAAPNTILTLSHWPKSGTPAPLKGDTSAAIVFNYLDSPRFHVEADAVSRQVANGAEGAASPSLEGGLTCPSPVA